MNYRRGYLLLACIAGYLCSTHLPYKLSFEPLWYKLDSGTRTLFNDNWMVIGKITFKNKTKESIKLDSLSFRWHGNAIDNLLGTLYKADTDEKFLPIESYVLADSVWHKTMQLMHFTFAKSYTIEPLSTFYLVLTIPDAVCRTIKEGNFSLVTDNLPHRFKEFARENIQSCCYTSHQKTLTTDPLKQWPKHPHAHEHHSPA